MHKMYSKIFMDVNRAPLAMQKQKPVHQVRAKNSKPGRILHKANWPVERLADYAANRD